MSPIWMFCIDSRQQLAFGRFRDFAVNEGRQFVVSSRRLTAQPIL
jgi:hypothetical protein